MKKQLNPTQYFVKRSEAGCQTILNAVVYAAKNDTTIRQDVLNEISMFAQKILQLTATHYKKPTVQLSVWDEELEKELFEENPEQSEVRGLQTI
jgi:hypothetical protein